MSICSHGDDVIAQASEAAVAAGSPISGDRAAGAGDDDARVRATTVVAGEKGTVGFSEVPDPNTPRPR